MTAPVRMSPWRWPLYAVGTAMMAYGVWGQVYGESTKPVRVAVLWVVAALAHDLVIAPIAFTLGWLARRAVPGRVRASLQGAVLVAVGLVLVAVPALGRYGERSDNTSVLPRDYTQGLLVALGCVAAGAVLHAGVRAVRSRT